MARGVQLRRAHWKGTRLMRNSVERSGVYSNMQWLLLLTVLEFAATATAQTQWFTPGGTQVAPRQPAMDVALQAAFQAQFGERAASRDQARAALDSMPADEPRFGQWAQSVAQLYQQNGMEAQGRAVLEQALARTAALGPSNPSRAEILSALGSLWQQDGNLLKALPYLEQAAAAEASATPRAGNAAPRAEVRSVIIAGPVFSRTGGYAASFRYIALANLYRQLGRPDAVEAVAAKIRAAASSPAELANFYQQIGNNEAAAEAYRQAVAEAKDPQAKISALHALANIYSAQQQPADAATAMEQAVAAAQQAEEAPVRNQLPWMQQQLANYLQRAGQTQQADDVYAQVMRDSQSGPQENQMLILYANYLAQTKRASQGEQVLQNYLDSNPDLEPWQHTSLLFALANLARMGGDQAAAERYQKQAQATQPAPPRNMETESDRDLEQAQVALNHQQFDSAFTLALAGIDAAAAAPGDQQVVWRAPQVAEVLEGNQQPARAEQIFERLFGVVQGWSTENMQPLISVSQGYARFLMNHKDRWNEVPAAMERYRAALIAANGADSGQLAEPLRMTLQFEQQSGQKQNAAAAAQQLLKLQEALSGNTSEPYFMDLQNAARAYLSTGDTQGAVPLLRQAVAVADVLGENGWRRSSARVELALALARLGQFDEAESLAEEASRLAKPAGQFAQQLQQIRQMKAAAAAGIRN